jgi:hypothetical protein
MQKHSTSKVSRSSKKTAPKKTRQPDPLKAYKADAKQIISLIYEQDTPKFILDILQEWLTGLENETQVFWNHRPILEIALPLMLREADESGIDYLGSDSRFNVAILQTVAAEQRDRRELREETTEEEILYREIQRDAEAIARIIKSPRVPEEIKVDLSNRFFEEAGSFSLAPEVIREQWTLAALKFCAEEKDDPLAHLRRKPKTTVDQLTTLEQLKNTPIEDLLTLPKDAKILKGRGKR